MCISTEEFQDWEFKCNFQFFATKKTHAPVTHIHYIIMCAYVHTISLYVTGSYLLGTSKPLRKLNWKSSQYILSKTFFQIWIKQLLKLSCCEISHQKLLFLDDYISLLTEKHTKVCIYVQHITKTYLLGTIVSLNLMMRIQLLIVITCLDNVMMAGNIITIL